MTDRPPQFYLVHELDTCFFFTLFSHIFSLSSFQSSIITQVRLNIWKQRSTDFPSFLVKCQSFKHLNPEVSQATLTLMLMDNLFKEDAPVLDTVSPSKADEIQALEIRLHNSSQNTESREASHITDDSNCSATSLQQKVLPCLSDVAYGSLGDFKVVAAPTVVVCESPPFFLYWDSWFYQKPEDFLIR